MVSRKRSIETGWICGFVLRFLILLAVVPAQYAALPNVVNSELQSPMLAEVSPWNSIDEVTNSVASSRRLRAVDGPGGRSPVNKTLIITSVLSAPYFMLRESAENLSGNDRYEGFIVDLIDIISQVVGFNYTFKVADDGKYGQINPEGLWNGMIGEVITGKADMAAADVTITYARAAVLDFTMPFLRTGIGLLYKKAQAEEPNLYSFLLPFSAEVWVYIAAAYLIVSLMLYLVSRISPFEWNNPHPCRQHPDILENQFTLLNSLWFPIGSLVRKSSDLTPRATSSRIIAGCWWLFMAVMTCLYIAKSVPILSAGKSMDSPLKTIEDVARQTEIKYGCVESGSTCGFFKTSNLGFARSAWDAMAAARPSVFTKSNMEGVERVQRSKGKYAYFMESTSIEYVVERNCDLTQIGGIINPKGYGLAMRIGNPLVHYLNQVILRMEENQQLAALQRKWWHEMRGGGACTDDDDASSGSALAGLVWTDVGGLFFILAFGCVIALLVAIVELAWNSRELALDSRGEENKGVWSTMLTELKVMLDCSKNTKPAPVSRR